jgi:hypothetical protein
VSNSLSTTAIRTAEPRALVVEAKDPAVGQQLAPGGEGVARRDGQLGPADLGKGAHEPEPVIVGDAGGIGSGRDLREQGGRTIVGAGGGGGGVRKWREAGHRSWRISADRRLVAARAGGQYAIS